MPHHTYRSEENLMCHNSTLFEHCQLHIPALAYSTHRLSYFHLLSCYKGCWDYRRAMESTLPYPSLDSVSRSRILRQPLRRPMQAPHLSYPVKHTPWCQSADTWTCSVKIKTPNTNPATDESSESWSMPMS